MVRVMGDDIPDKTPLSRAIQAIAASCATGRTPETEYLPTLLSIIAGNVMALEERVIALERKVQ
jgi:hypothetical protein